MIHIFKLIHKGNKYIGIEKNSNLLIDKKIASLPGTWYSDTYHCYVMHYRSSYFARLKVLNFPIQILERGAAETAVAESDCPATELVLNKSADPVVQLDDQDADMTSEKMPIINWNGKFFTIILKYNEGDVSYIKSLDRSYWSKKHGNWVLAPSTYNLKKLQTHFRAWSQADYSRLLELISLQEKPFNVDIYKSPEFPGKFLVKVYGFRANVSPIKLISGRSYDKAYRRWIIPFDIKTIKGLVNYYERQGARVSNRIPSVSIVQYQKAHVENSERRSSILSKFENREAEVLGRYFDQMIIQNYGWRTIKSYTNKFGRFLLFTRGKQIEDLTVDDANQYLIEVNKERISESLNNVIISAIKFYFEKVLYEEKFEIDRLNRPRSGKYLPTILSEREIDRMFRTVSNIKHVAIMYMMYGGGLRLSELLRLRVKDVLWERNQILVKSGKGRKDRVTLLGTALKNVLQIYLDEHQPTYWLFEGSDKIHPYSKSSVTNIVRKAARKAGITRKVTPHTIRHCFATHLLDRGTDVRYIQELLGHRDIKTTLIYTHVTNLSLSTIESPLERLDRKKELGK